jgi:Holliday junction DNA helicase RuvA
MFAKLKGYVEEIIEDYIILNVNDVGYMIFCSNKTINQVSDKKEKISLYIETVVKEDSITLFGFLNQIEKDTFNTLCKVSGVSGKMSMKIMSLLTIKDISYALINNDSKMFCGVSGIGPKLATRIVLELKDCFLTKNFEYNTINDTNINAILNKDIVNDAILALEGLGYQKSKIKDIVLKIMKEKPDLTLESVITNALKLI